MGQTNLSKVLNWARTILEVGELSPFLVDRFIAEGLSPNFKTLREQSEVFVKHTSYDSLQPRAQWATFHSGKPQKDDGIHSLEEGHLVEKSMMWDHLAGRRTVPAFFCARKG